MSMSPETVASVAVTVVTGVTGVWAARAARRTPQQERRDDFTAMSEQQGKAIERLENRIRLREEEATAQQERLAETDEAVAWLVTRVRDLVAAIRKTGGEPPAPRPMSARAARVLERSDV